MLGTYLAANDPIVSANVLMAFSTDQDDQDDSDSVEVNIF